MGCCARVAQMRTFLCGPESYCRVCWRVSPQQREHDKHHPLTRIAVLVTPLFGLLALIFCFLAFKPGATQSRLYMILFSTFLGMTFLPIFLRCCCLTPPKALPKPPPSPKPVAAPPAAEERKLEEVHV